MYLQEIFFALCIKIFYTVSKEKYILKISQNKNQYIFSHIK